MYFDESTERAQQDAFEKAEKFVGKYVIIFQTLESYLDQMLRLIIGLNQYHIGHSVVSRLTNRDKIEVLQSVLHQSKLKDAGEFQQEWLSAFDKFSDRLRKEGERRNRLVHATFLGDSAHLSGHIHTVTVRTGGGKLKLKYETLDEKTCEEILEEVSTLALDASQAHVQLIHWVDVVQKQEGVLYSDETE